MQYWHVMGALYGYLYAEPSFLLGVASIMDFGNTLSEYNQSLNPEQADALALSTDWRTVGLELLKAMERFRGSISTKR